MANENKWKKIEPADAWDFEVNKVLVGTYLDVAEDVGENHSNLYSIRLKDGSVVPMWGSKILDVRLKNVEAGDEVKIEYKGMKEAAKGGRTYHDYDVWHRKPIKPPMEKIEDAHSSEKPI